MSSIRRIDDRHDTETYFVAFAKSPTVADIKRMKDALTAALPWPVTSVSAKQGEVIKSDAFDRFGRIHPKSQFPRKADLHLLFDIVFLSHSHRCQSHHVL